MSYEVELKFAVPEVESLLKKLQQFDVTFGEQVEECDTFYQHPMRDFAKTDECLRIRHRDGEYRITYKGPKIDIESKTRREIEIPLMLKSDGNMSTVTDWNALLIALGFVPVSELKKSRRKAAIIFQEQKFEISLDHLDALGDFIEIETLADDDSLAESQRQLKSLAATLGLSKPILASYLELVLDKEPHINQ